MKFALIALSECHQTDAAKATPPCSITHFSKINTFTTITTALSPSMRLCHSLCWHRQWHGRNKHPLVAVEQSFHWAKQITMDDFW